MNYLPLNINVNFEGWSVRYGRNRHPTFRTLMNKVFSRDKKTCRFCGYTGADIEVININGNYRDNSLNNLVTGCTLCAACNFVGSYKTGSSHTIDKIIILPEVDQAKLNHLVRLLFVSITYGNKDQKENAEVLYRSLRSRAKQVDQVFGENISDCQLFAQMISDSQVAKDKDSFTKVLNELRYLPSRKTFLASIATWKNYYQLNS